MLATVCPPPPREGSRRPRMAAVDLARVDVLSQPDLPEIEQSAEIIWKRAVKPWRDVRVPFVDQQMSWKMAGRVSARSESWL